MNQARLPTLLLGAAVGAVVTLAVTDALRRAPLAPPPAASGSRDDLDPTDDPDERADGRAPAAEAVERGLPVVLERLDRLGERLAGLETAVETLRAAPQRVEVAGSPTAVVDADALQDAMLELERRKLAEMSDEALLADARRLRKGDPSTAIERLQALLARPLSPEARGEAQLELATLLRGQGDPDSLARSSATLQSVIDANGMQSSLGGRAAYQLVWNHGKHGEPAAALALADELARTNPEPGLRQSSRWAAAILAQQLGDTARARADLQQLLHELQGQPDQEKLITDIQRRLEQLDR